jgi:chloramphenicol O-acetyltransferase type B
MRLIFSMSKLRQRLRRWKQRAMGLPVLQNYSLQQEKFQKKYPNYELGTGTYGLPTVHDANEGTTLRIGAFCSIASGVQIFLGNHHRTDWVSSYPFPAFFDEARHIPNFGVSRGDVTIGNDVWLCANCTILSGVTIGHGAVVGTGAVVTKDVEPYSIIAGNPAKHIRWRFDEETRAALLEAAWWNWSTAEILMVVKLICSDQVHDFLAYARRRK